MAPRPTVAGHQLAVAAAHQAKGFFRTPADHAALGRAVVPIALDTLLAEEIDGDQAFGFFLELSLEGEQQLALELQERAPFSRASPATTSRRSPPRASSRDM